MALHLVPGRDEWMIKISLQVEREPKPFHEASRSKITHGRERNNFTQAKFSALNQSPPIGAELYVPLYLGPRTKLSLGGQKGQSRPPPDDLTALIAQPQSHADVPGNGPDRFENLLAIFRSGRRRIKIPI